MARGARLGDWLGRRQCGDGTWLGLCSWSGDGRVWLGRSGDDQNRQSPYFLGAWYPDNQPDFFFRPAQVKAPYQQLLFAPQYRLPLYQAVFHDEIISCHHWHSDSLKFSDVQGWRDITAMLYNTPPMVHLNRNTAKAGSARIKALQHYQQAFYRCTANCGISNWSSYAG
ncbi:hypothetical protein PCI56_10175 [Plesiomonas shigelloides subsp. oncorhynchi]|nr:hypothetical protein [Plesiomonas shigelloides]